MRIKKYAIGFLCALGVIGLCACSPKVDKYNAYHEEVNKLYEKIVTTGAIIGNIDVNCDNYTEELYESLDGLKQAFDDFSEIEPPKEFADCQKLSKSASTYITNSEKCFHMAFDNEYNEEMFNTGVSNYNEVIKCVNYMGEVLQKK